LRRRCGALASATLTNRELRARVQEVAKNSYELGAGRLRAFDERELPMPPDRLVLVMQSLIEGLVMQRRLTPERCPGRRILGLSARTASSSSVMS
jgi:hypothetical protein